MNTNNRLAAQLQSLAWPKATPPKAVKKTHTRTIHNDIVNDDYYWMIDYFKKGADSNNVVAYLKEENAYLDTMMKHTQSLQKELFTEMKARIKEKDESVPAFKNGYYYYSRTETGQQYYKYCRKKGSLSAAEEILLDVDELAKGHPYYSVAGFSISPNNNFLVFGEDTVSRRQYNMLVKDLSTGQIQPQGVQNTAANFVWANDNASIFYTANNPETLLTEKIKKHVLNTPAGGDVLVYEEKDKSNYIGIGKTMAENYLIISSESTTSSEARYLDANTPGNAFAIFQPRTPNVLYDVDADDESFYIRTNKNALNFKLVKTGFKQTQQQHWKDVVPHRNDVLFQNALLLKNYLILSEKKDALDKIRIIDKKTNADMYLPFDEAVYAAMPGNNPEYNASVLRYNYYSLTTPSSVYDYDLKTGKKILLKQQEVLGGYNPSDYQSERIYATATDGTKIPVSIVYKKGFKNDGSQPLLLYGYGSYGNSMPPTFSSNRISLLNRGFAFAIAHIRGGQELGRSWYENGKMMKKKNTFTDFIDCAKFLIAKQYTSPAHLYANGGSAGGLLMGAVANMAPDLFNGMVADVPFVDVVNTMMDPTIPLTTNEYEEWGNPDNKEAYMYMKSYSPYENVTAKSYPNLLVTTGLHDSQVQYFEPAKWVAKLRDIKKGDNVLFLKTNMDFGHGGASGRFDYLKDIALSYAFYFTLEGIQK